MSRMIIFKSLSRSMAVERRLYATGVIDLAFSDGEVKSSHERNRYDHHNVFYHHLFIRGGWSKG